MNEQHGYNDTLQHRGEIIRFWFPLWLTWFMMALEGPYLTSIVARLAMPTENLAAHGVATAIGWIVEAPIMMILSATVALGSSRLAYERIRNFTYILNTVITLVMAVLAFTPAFDLVASMLGLKANVAELTRLGITMLLPWPAAIGFRRLYQGVLIRNGKTRAVALGTVVRLVSMSATAYILATFTSVPGIIVSGASLSAGVVFEWFAAWYFVQPLLKNLPLQSSTPVMNYPALAKYYFPLMMTSLISLVAQPILTFFLGQSRMPLESLALLPVLSSFTFMFKTVGISFQEVVIALAGSRLQNIPLLRSTGFRIGLTLSAVFLIIVVTPLSYVWFGMVVGLPDSLYNLIRLPSQLAFMLPFVALGYAFYAASALVNNDNSWITYATALEVAVIILTLFVSIGVFDALGIVAAALALVLGRSTSAGVLALRSARRQA